MFYCRLLTIRAEKRKRPSSLWTTQEEDTFIIDHLAAGTQRGRPRSSRVTVRFTCQFRCFGGGRRRVTETWDATYKTETRWRHLQDGKAPAMVPAITVMQIIKKTRVKCTLQKPQTALCRWGGVVRNRCWTSKQPPALTEYWSRIIRLQRESWWLVAVAFVSVQCLCHS